MSFSLVQIIRQWARSNVFGILKDQGQGERVFQNVGNSPPPISTAPQTRILEYSETQMWESQDTAVGNTLLHLQWNVSTAQACRWSPPHVGYPCLLLHVHESCAYVRPSIPHALYFLNKNDTGKESVNLKIYILWKKIQNVILISLVPLPFWVPVSYPPQNVGNSCHTRV